MADSDYSKVQFEKGGLYPDSVSSITPTSGTIASASSLVSFSGPWLVETQTLDIDYVRVPAGGLNVATRSITLSGAALTYTSPQATRLVGAVRAGYSRTIDYNNYSTSSYQQPQLFEVMGVSSDPNGASYGTAAEALLTVGAGVALGPMGSILTLQPFYRRTLYNSETVVASSVTVATFALSAPAMPPGSGPWSMPSVNQADYLTDYEFWKDRGCVPGTQRTGDRPDLIQNTWHGVLLGSYDYASESALFISTWIDIISDYLATKTLYAMPSQYGTPGGNGYHNGLQEYSKMRHKY